MRHPDRFAWPEGIRAGISLTFDDGRASQLERAIPIVAAHDVKATFYPNVSVVEDAPDAWKALLAAGHEIGNHTLSHICSGNFGWGEPTLESLDLAWIENDILVAQARLTDALGVAPRTFAYPCGQPFVGRGVEKRSYAPIVAKHFLSGRGFMDEPLNDPSFCDLCLLNGTEGDGLSVEQLKGIAGRALEAGGWVVLAIHGVDGDGRRQSISTHSLDRFCAHCKAADSGIWIDAVEHIADYIQQSRSGV